MQAFQARKTLMKKQAELQKRLDAIQSDRKKSHSRDWSEQAQERENDEVLDALAVETASELKRIRAALAKLGTDDYGICRECGELISEQRLSVLPEAEFCINCADNQG